MVGVHVGEVRASLLLSCPVNVSCILCSRVVFNGAAAFVMSFLVTVLKSRSSCPPENALRFFTNRVLETVALIARAGMLPAMPLFVACADTVTCPKLGGFGDAAGITASWSVTSCSPLVPVNVVPAGTIT